MTLDTGFEAQCGFSFELMGHSDGRLHGQTGERADIGMGRAGGRPGARRWTFWAAKQTPPRRGFGQPRGTASAMLKDVLKDVHFWHTLV